MNYWLIILLLSFTHTALAGSLNDVINQQRLRRDAFVAELSAKHHNFTAYQTAAQQQLSTHRAVVQQIKDDYLQQTAQPPNVRAAPPALVFVSFSLPDASLKQILHDAARYHMPVVWRGLYQNSMRATLAKFFTFFKTNNQGGALINPVWFKTYQINAVPAVVVNQGAEFDVVYGNIPVKTALTLIANQGKLAKLAQEVLNRDPDNARRSMP